MDPCPALYLTPLASFSIDDPEREFPLDTVATPLLFTTAAPPVVPTDDENQVAVLTENTKEPCAVGVCSDTSDVPKGPTEFALSELPPPPIVFLPSDVKPDISLYLVDIYRREIDGLLHFLLIRNSCRLSTLLRTHNDSHEELSPDNGLKRTS